MAIVDSSVLIHLSRISKLSLLKKYFKEITITKEIYKEIEQGRVGFSEIEEALENWIFISEVKNLNEAINIAKLDEIEQADASIITLAKEKKDILLSNDYALITIAKSKGIRCLWLTTFILKCLKKKIITKKEAKQILYELIQSGMRLNNEVYAAILNEIEKT